MKKFFTIIILSLFGNFVSAQKSTFTIVDLIAMSKCQFGFVTADGSINEYYGDFDCSSTEKYTFDFNVGCGKAGDIITFVIKEDKTRKSTFGLYLKAGSIFYGKPTPVERRVGEFVVLSESKIKGSIKLCLNKSDGCCGEEGENFTLLKIK